MRIAPNAKTRESEYQVVFCLLMCISVLRSRPQKPHGQFLNILCVATSFGDSVPQILAALAFLISDRLNSERHLVSSLEEFLPSVLQPGNFQAINWVNHELHFVHSPSLRNHYVSYQCPMAEN
jgi:hypothetical protein